MLGSIDDRFTEFVVYGIIFLVLIVLLVIVAVFMKKMMASRARNITTPFGMTQQEMDKLKQAGALTEDEMKRVRSAMAKQLVERFREEDNKKNMTGGAEVALASFEARVQNEGLDRVKNEEFSGEKAPVVPVEKSVLIAQPSSIVKLETLPPNLQPLLGKTDMELEELAAAGFLTAEELAIVRKAATQ
ncbi:MAG: hypothetical protein ABI579_10035 [Candidatus Sumerlaeota bacterium]